MTYPLRAEPSESMEYGIGTATKGPVNGEWFGIMANRSWRADGTVPGFIYCPAYQAGGFNIAGWGPARQMARRGYVVLCGDFGCTPTTMKGTNGAHKWGNDAAQAKFDTYKAYLHSVLGAKTGKIGVMGGSGGATLAYSWSYAHQADVFCVATGIGSVDIEDIRVNDYGDMGYDTSLYLAYGDNTAWQAARPTHNPVEVAGALADAGVPQLDYYSTDDPLCVPATHAALASAAGGLLTQRSLGAIGHTTGPLLSAYSDETVAFADWVEDTLV